MCQSLRTLRPENLIALGIALGLSYPTILRMGSGDDFLNRIVAAWLNRQDNVLKYSGEPTWRVLADKLEKLGQKEITTDIRRRDDDPRHRGKSEQQLDGNPPTLLIESSDSYQNSTNLSGELCAHSSDWTTTPISIEPMTQSEQDQPHSR